MNLPRPRLVMVAAVAVSAIAIGGSVLAAGAASAPTTYYACLKSGTLSNVGTTAPKCTSPATRISWNQTGPQGPTGAAGNTILSGTGAPTSTIGAAGNFYLETSNYSIYGPATRNCSHLPCQTVWGTGTSLVGPQGPPGTSGQGVAYDTQTPTPAAIDDPNGQVETVLTQTLPVGGDFQIVANVTGENDRGDDVFWECHLDAANPGGATVNLGNNSATNTGIGGTVGDETNLSLQGVVSIAAGGTISIVCGEYAARENDSFIDAHITSTQVSGLSIVAPS